jgi:cytosine/adenosine deaminase-related metal-dependent hydrolase
MRSFRAAWVCPMAGPPIRDGWWTVADGTIVDVGTPGRPAPAGARDLGSVAVLPGLVNTHTHLELSWLRGRVPPAGEFVSWIKQLILARGARQERVDDPVVIEAARTAAFEARAFGTAALGDISNSLASVQALAEADVDGLVFHELLGFKDLDGRAVIDTRAVRRDIAARAPAHVRVSVCPHAPYSTSPELFRAIRAEVDASDVPITSVHLGESEGEVAFLRDGGGPWPGMLRFIGVMRDDWVTPGVDPVAYLDAVGLLDARTLVVHGVQFEAPALDRLAAIGCTLVTCPRSNQWVGVGVPPIERFYASGVKVAIGTDSLASVDDLNVFEELKAMRWLAPSVPARRLLESATVVGAAALGLGDALGTIEPGKRAALIAVELPGDVDDVEEYLVSGIAERQIRWVTA